MRILIVEDDPTLAANLGEYLEEQGDEPDYATDGRMALSLCQAQDYDVLVLDLRMPRMDGLTLCRRLRAGRHRATPILMLTARDTVEDRIEGFEAGTDDYLVKPFSLRELYLRLLALVRRRAAEPADVLAHGALVLDDNLHQVTFEGETIALTPIAFNMLRLLMQRAPGVVRRADFEREIWAGEPPGSTAALRGHVHRLRELMESATGRPVIRTVHGIGYQLIEPE